MYTDFFKLIRLGIGLGKDEDDVLRLDSKRWSIVIKQLQEQAMMGIGFAGLQRLPKEDLPPRPLLLQWIAIAEKIKQRNDVLDKTVIKLSKKLDDDGWRFCVLKGQTVAQYYPTSSLRQSGDIDVWIYGRKDSKEVCRKDIIRYLERNGRKVKLCYLHADGIMMAGDVSVEVHFHPSFSVCPWKNAHLQSALKDLAEPTACNINGESIPSATYKFNRLFMLHHIYRHLFSEGIGMRQIVDYAMLLLLHNDGIDNDFEKTLKRLGMLQFAQGVMWILSAILNVPQSCLYTKADEKEGRYLLNEILQSGNFGQASTTGVASNTKWQRFAKKTKHNLSFVKKYPSEVLWYVPFEVFETIAYKIPHR